MWGSCRRWQSFKGLSNNVVDVSDAFWSGIIGLTQDDESNFDHIAQQCLLLCTDYVHQLVLSYAGKDVQGGHRNDLVKTMRGVFRENPKSRMSVRDIGALEAFSAKARDANRSRL